ncbi:MAG: aldo/keto reductase [Treponema sp.]|nr:aldo/keto reductase [Treponema sp.]
MQYRTDRKGEQISLLGYGCMRFSSRAGGIDIDKAEAEILEAVRAGVNYFDTAYIYPGSEATLGTIVARNGLRGKIKIATKLPQYLVGSRKALDRFFDEQLFRLQTDYVDYYLMHHLTDIAAWEKLKELGITEWIAEKKKAGQIRNIGFSFHGDSEMFLKILHDYDWDICLVQYNYMDEHSQAGRAGVEECHRMGIPLVVMEPLRGGKLVNLLPEAAKKLIAGHPRNWTSAEWAFRWLYNQEGVSCVLSGMNSLDMIWENCRVAAQAQAGELTEEDLAFINRLRQEIRAKVKVNCTACRYCMPCPKNVDIPGIFRCYNEMFTERKSAGRFEFAQTVGLRKQSAFASQCIGCGKCEQHCPQNIAIRAELKKADRALRPLPYRIGIAVARRFMLKG